MPTPTPVLRLALRAALFALLAGAAPFSLRAQTVNIAVDASQTVRTVDQRLFGVNTVMWDHLGDDNDTIAQTVSLMQEAGVTCLRLPGGSNSDTWVWNQDKSYDTTTGLLNTWTWMTTWNEFAQVVSSMNVPVFATTNYGSGTATLAADWVRDANITRHLGIRYWEIGNECYGSWEYDTHAVKNDPYTYALAARDYIAAMKAVDPTIKIGVVAVVGEDTYGNATHTATNPRTHVAHTGWTPVMLANLATLGVTPDFLIYHRYEQTPGQETDAGLLQDAATWPADIADLRQQLNDYLGTATAAHVEIVITENNSVFSDPGKQSTSLVNGLFLADSLANVMQTEANAYMWWALRNGTPTSSTGALLGNFSSALYGWRTYGDYGMLSMPNAFGATTYYDRHPTFYALKLLQRFVRGGDTIIHATSSSTLLSAYAARRADGTLAILVINKSPTATQTANISVAGMTPTTPPAAYSYGIPQDNAARTGSGSPDIASSAVAASGATVSASFAPYSATVLAFIDGVPSITTQPANQTANVGGSATFSVTATGAAPLSYQWSKAGTAIAGATSATLSLSNVQTTDAASYTVTVTNSVTSMTSNAATLTVNTPPPTTTIPPSSGGGGGGGGALSTWFYAALALLAAARLGVRRQPQGR